MQQLCEAGEAEFLEIMDLVGMASKPMHVRRLQKALQEWVQNPGKVFFFHAFFKVRTALADFSAFRIRFLLWKHLKVCVLSMPVTFLTLIHNSFIVTRVSNVQQSSWPAQGKKILGLANFLILNIDT